MDFMGRRGSLGLNSDQQEEELTMRLEPAKKGFPAPGLVTCLFAATSVWRRSGTETGEVINEGEKATAAVVSGSATELSL